MRKDNSIKATKYIRKIMQHSDDLMRLCPIEKIQGLAFDKNITFPYIIIKRSSLTPNPYNYTKSLGTGELQYNTINYQIDVHHNSYDNSIELANEVRASIEGTGWKDDDIVIDRIHITNVLESATGEGEYIQTIMASVEAY